jgi:hypothetical protein
MYYLSCVDYFCRPLIKREEFLKMKAREVLKNINLLGLNAEI